MMTKQKTDKFFSEWCESIDGRMCVNLHHPHRQTLKEALKLAFISGYFFSQNETAEQLSEALTSGDGVCRP